MLHFAAYFARWCTRFILSREPNIFSPTAPEAAAPYQGAAIPRPARGRTLSEPVPGMDASVHIAQSDGHRNSFETANVSFGDPRLCLPTLASSSSPAPGRSTARAKASGVPFGVPVLPMQSRNSSIAAVPHEPTPMIADRPTGSHRKTCAARPTDSAARPSRRRTRVGAHGQQPPEHIQPLPPTPPEDPPEPVRPLAVKHRSRAHSLANVMAGKGTHNKTHHRPQVSEYVHTQGESVYYAKDGGPPLGIHNTTPPERKHILDDDQREASRRQPSREPKPDGHASHNTRATHVLICNTGGNARNSHRDVSWHKQSSAPASPQPPEESSAVWHVCDAGGYQVPQVSSLNTPGTSSTPVVFASTRWP